MTLVQLAPPYPVFTGKNGDPLDAGFLYFGVANLNPETNPIQVYWDSALTQPAAQPIRTINGYPSSNGALSLIYADSQFSVTVRDKNNEFVIYSPIGFGFVPGTSATSTDQITYNEGSTGAIDRVLTSRLQDRVSVKDFGAVDGGPNTAAINAAIAYAIASGNRVEFPFAGTIRVPEDAPTLQAAIDAIYPDPTVGFLLTINLSAGYQIAEGTLIENGDYSNVQITSSDATVNAANPFAGVSGGDVFSTNSLLVVKKATAPRWEIFVDCNNFAGGLVYTQAKGFIGGSKGVTDSLEFGLYVVNQSSVFASNSIFTLSGYGNRVTVNSMLCAPQANFSGAKAEFYVGANRSANLDVSRGSLVYITGTAAAPTNLTGGLGRGLAVRRSFVSATNVDCSGVGVNGLTADLGSVVSFNGSIASNCGQDGVYSAGIVYFNDSAVAINNANFNLFANNGGYISARGATLTGGGVQGVRAAMASTINIPYANCWRNGASDQTTDIVVTDGSYISAVGALGGTPVNPLFPTMSGTIIKNTDTVDISPRGSGDVLSFVDVNFPEVSSSDSAVRFFRNTNTTGLARLIVYAGDGTSTAVANLNSSGDLTIAGNLTKGSGSFRIDHPLKPDTHHLVHSFIEGPQADNLYRGCAPLVGGKATVNLDVVARMTDGTFVALNTNVQCFTANESGWTQVRGSVSGNILTIEAQDASCTDTVSWMAIGERQDQHMLDAKWTDENGRVITEPLKEQSND
jgi:hypothetical protein